MFTIICFYISRITENISKVCSELPYNKDTGKLAAPSSTQGVTRMELTDFSSWNNALSSVVRLNQLLFAKHYNNVSVISSHLIWFLDDFIFTFTKQLAAETFIVCCTDRSYRDSVCSVAHWSQNTSSSHHQPGACSEQETPDDSLLRSHWSRAIDVLLSLVEMVHGVAPTALLCHKELAQGAQSPFLAFHWLFMS